MATKLTGANKLQRILLNFRFASLDDARNREALDALACSFPSLGPVHTVADIPQAFFPLRLYERELIVHMRWLEVVEAGVRVFVITNSGHSPWALSRAYTVMPCQTVAAVLPNATITHVLALTAVPSIRIFYPHLPLAAAITRETAAMSADHLWTLHGDPLPLLQGPHGYRFAGCIDGILYAVSLSPSFDPRAAMMVKEELLALAASPWQRPPLEATEHAAMASAAVGKRLMNRQWRIMLIGIAAVLGLSLLGEVLRLLKLGWP